jgi:spoIIIJ-associated protein
VATPEEELSETAKNARSFLQGLTDKMGVPAEIAVGESTEQLRMVLSGENMSILIGRRGETLDALQYLTSLNVNRGREDYLRVSLDTENYRAKREEALRKLAVRMAGRCKKSGRRVALEPMNPYERRILHSALQADPDVTTHSEGEEPYRRVIITLK